MSIPIYDPDLSVIKCADGSCETGCNTDGCEKMFAIGDCSAIINAVNPATGEPNIQPYVLPADMIFDTDSWCLINRLKNTTIDMNIPPRKNGYLHGCGYSHKGGRPDPSITVDLNYCRDDETHCRLHRASVCGGKVAFMCMENRADFLPNVSANLQPDIFYGIAYVQSTSINNTFDQEDNRVYTLLVDEQWWMFNTCMSGAQLRALQYETPQGEKPALTQQSLAADPKKQDKAA